MIVDAKLLFVGFSPEVFALGRENPRLDVILPAHIHNVLQMILDLVLINLEKKFDAPVEVAAHPVGGSQKNAAAGVVVENVNARVLQKPPDEAVDLDIFA